MFGPKKVKVTAEDIMQQVASRHGYSSFPTNELLPNGDIKLFDLRMFDELMKETKKARRRGLFIEDADKPGP